MIMEHGWNNGETEKQIIRKEICRSAILSTSNLTQTNCVPNRVFLVSGLCKMIHISTSKNFLLRR